MDDDDEVDVVLEDVRLVSDADARLLEDLVIPEGMVMVVYRVRINGEPAGFRKVMTKELGQLVGDREFDDFLVESARRAFLDGRIGGGGV